MPKEEGIKAKSGCPATDYNWHAARKKPYVSRTQVSVTRYRTANRWQFFFNQFVAVFVHFLIHFCSVINRGTVLSSREFGHHRTNVSAYTFECDLFGTNMVFHCTMANIQPVSSVGPDSQRGNDRP